MLQESLELIKVHADSKFENPSKCECVTAIVQFNACFHFQHIPSSLNGTYMITKHHYQQRSATIPHAKQQHPKRQTTLRCPLPV